VITTPNNKGEVMFNNISHKVEALRKTLKELETSVEAKKREIDQELDLYRRNALIAIRTEFVNEQLIASKEKTDFEHKFHSAIVEEKDRTIATFTEVILVKIAELEAKVAELTPHNNTRDESCLCFSCSRLLSDGGSCQPSTNSFVTACGGYSGKR
jgi:uncharacterized protein (DUF488 family)